MEKRTSAQVHDGPHLVLLWQEAHLGATEAAGLEDAEGFLSFNLLEHVGLEQRHSRFGHIAPNVVAEEEQAVAVDAGLGHVKVAPNQGY